MNSVGLFTLEHELQNAKYYLTLVPFFPPIILWGGGEIGQLLELTCNATN